MFDGATLELIGRAPPLTDLSLDELPQRLTEAFASIVAARVRLRAGEAAHLSEKLSATIDELRRVAATHEAFVSALPDRADRAAAAFVAAAAHHASLLAADLERPAKRPPSHVRPDCVSSEVAAALLFLIADAQADAAEMAKRIETRGDDPVESALLRCVGALATGELEHILRTPLPTTETILAGPPETQAWRALLHLLLRGVRALALDLLGAEAVFEFDVADLKAGELFERAASLAIEPIGGASTPGYSVYPGPLHMARLLQAAARDLRGAATAALPAPRDLDPGHWAVTMDRLARRRPYLWRNHLAAVHEGYLESGTSAVISFPTGGGKSTLAELKIATALLHGVKVVFLVPTLALVDQTCSALKVSFPEVRVRGEARDVGLDEEEELSEISVMTPERGLAMLALSPDSAQGVGLVVFDECHLLHPSDLVRSRRSIDAMLCLLNLTMAAPDADVLLLSAMLSNTAELARWVQAMTGRPALALDVAWKPTRQVRGCVVYDAHHIAALNRQLLAGRATATPGGNVPAALARQMTAAPLGFFSLQQTWASQQRAHYALLPLLDEMVQLATAKTARDRWYLTPNANKVSAQLAAAAARQGLKTLVFAQSKKACATAAREAAAALAARTVQLTNDEQALYDIAVDEAGGAPHLYLSIDKRGHLEAASACHHGLLLPVERQLHQSLFTRRDGIDVLVATSTLAQGMNLPSEVVIIAGDSRFDPDAGTLEQLEAHELLNAAGRAGRAGQGAHGFVLVVPSKVVDFDDAQSQINRHWSTLQAIFAQSDQCLVVDDPLTALLDEIHIAQPLSDAARYLLRRLPVASDDADPDGPARELLGRSLAACRAREGAEHDWLATRIASALRHRAELQVADAETWVQHLAAATGVPIEIIQSLDAALEKPPSFDDVPSWREWMIKWLKSNPAFLLSLVRPDGLEQLLGAGYRTLEDQQAKGQRALPIVSALLDDWMAGAPLAVLERTAGTRPDHLGQCEKARLFVIQLVPELAYVAGLIARADRARREAVSPFDDEALGSASLVLAHLGTAIRDGVDSLEAVALGHHYPKMARRRRHAEMARLQPLLPKPAAGEDFVDIVNRVGRAVALDELL